MLTEMLDVISVHFYFIFPSFRIGKYFIVYLHQEQTHYVL